MVPVNLEFLFAWLVKLLKVVRCSEYTHLYLFSFITVASYLRFTFSCNIDALFHKTRCLETNAGNTKSSIYRERTTTKKSNVYIWPSFSFEVSGLEFKMFIFMPYEMVTLWNILNGSNSSFLEGFQKWGETPDISENLSFMLLFYMTLISILLIPLKNSL